MNETIVLYHGGCRDGFCAAWVVNKYFNNILHSSDLEAQKNIQYIPAYYGTEPPDVTGKDVIIVDFCYPLEVMIDTLNKSNHLIWLDHHKTAKSVADSLGQLVNNREEDWNKIQYIFDNNRSGAGIAWDYLFGNKERPWIVDYVEDRDLWNKKLNNTEEVNAYVACLEFDFTTWNEASEESVEDIAMYGQTAIMKTEQYVREVCKNVYFAIIKAKANVPEGTSDYWEHEWFSIPIVNIPQVDCSEVMDSLLKQYPESPFSLYWFRRPDGMYQYGMRSKKDQSDFDVSEVAKIFGGGGHKNAAGFQLPYLLEELK